MSKKRFEEQLEALDQIREMEPLLATDALRKALRNRSNYYVAKAAKITAELVQTTLIPDLLTSFNRFFESDPQCWAKNAIVRALADLAHTESAPYLRGLRHVQMEPVWGGQADTAGPLRARCAVALPQCRDLTDHQLLTHLIESLADPDKTVRAESARAIARIDRPESALLLRLRALVGDPDAEASGACFTALLAVEGPSAFPFVARFLDDPEAALSLGMTHAPVALKILQGQWQRTQAPVLLTAIALTNLPEALDFLIDQVSANSVVALEALASARPSPELRTRITAAVESTDNPTLRTALNQHFPKTTEPRP